MVTGIDGINTHIYYANIYGGRVFVFCSFDGLALLLWFDDFDDDDALFCRWGVLLATTTRSKATLASSSSSSRRRRRRTTTSSSSQNRRQNDVEQNQQKVEEEEEDGTTYDRLKEKLAEIDCLSSLAGLAGWDELTMMPSGEHAAKLLESVRRARWSDPSKVHRRRARGVDRDGATDRGERRGERNEEGRVRKKRKDSRGYGEESGGVTVGRVPDVGESENREGLQHVFADIERVGGSGQSAVRVD